MTQAVITRQPINHVAAPDAFSQALEQEKLQNARRLNTIRLIGVSLFLALEFWQDVLAKPPAERAYPFLLAGYWILSAALFWLSRRFESVARRSSFAIVVVDMPMVFLAQSAAFLHSTSPRALADFTLGIYVCLLVLAALSLEKRQIYLAALVGAALQLLLQYRAGDSLMGKVGGVLLLGIVAMVGHYSRRRWIELVRVVCDAQLRRERLGRYFSPQVAAHIEKQADHLAGGQQCEVTVLFSDIRGFTSLSEKLDSTQVVALLNEFHARMVEAVFAYGGTLDKYTGDGLMAYFGAPVPQLDHAERAVRCAMAMQMSLAHINGERKIRGEPALRMGVGIHTGPAVVGSIGAPHRREFTAVGDTVNLASRLEQLTKQLDEAIVISEETRERIGEGFDFRHLDMAQVKGKTTPIQTYAPVLWKVSAAGGIAN